MADFAIYFEIALAAIILASVYQMVTNFEYYISLNNVAINKFNAEEDFFNLLLKDPTVRNNFSRLNDTYIMQILEKFYNSYKLDCIAYSVENFYYSYGNCNCKYESIICMPQNLGSNYSIGCIRVCSD
ncbi:MAG: hypothetical protein QXN16_00475 [Candidatus Micrarchaeaceae archaeon]